MRRAILAEALSGSGLHFYCGGEAVLFDICRRATQGGFAADEAVISELSQGRGKYRGIRTAAHTNAAEAAVGVQISGVQVLTPAGPKSDCDNGAVFTLRRITVDSERCIYQLSADGCGVLICGSCGGDELAAALSKSKVQCEHAFVPPGIIFSAPALDALTKAGVSHIFIHRIHQEADDEFDRRLAKRMTKLSRKGAKLRLIDKYPTGIII